MIGLCNLLITNVHVSHSYLFDPVKNEVTAFHPLLIVLPAFFARFTAPSTPLASLYDVVLYNDLCTHVCKGCQQIGKNDYYLAICSSFSPYRHNFLSHGHNFLSAIHYFMWNWHYSLWCWCHFLRHAVLLSLNIYNSLCCVLSISCYR